MGVMEGGGAGKFLAEWIESGEPPMDALAVDPRRFGDYANREFRVAKAIESFAHQFGIHYPKEERPAGRPAVTSPFYQISERSWCCVWRCHTDGSVRTGFEPRIEVQRR